VAPGGRGSVRLRGGAPVYGSAIISGVTVLCMPANRTAAYADTFTYAISDGVLTDMAVVTVTVAADNDRPTISNIRNQHAGMGVPVGPITCTVGDPDTFCLLSDSERGFV